MPPELFQEALIEPGSPGASAWDIAVRYHELKVRAVDRQKIAALRKLSAETVLRKARDVLGSVTHPSENRTAPWTELEPGATQVDFDLEETLEHVPMAAGGKNPVAESDIHMSYQIARKQPMILSVDTSLSMTGEKLALTAVALAVVLLQFPDDPIGIVAFENEAKVLKRPDEKISIQELVERFLDVPAQGYTHLEDGMKESLKLARMTAGRRRSARPASTVLLTDGKYTAGRDPAYLASRFRHLVVMKMGSEKASLPLCRELAQKGHGMLREVPELEALPSVMYGVVKDLLRGKSVS